MVPAPPTLPFQCTQVRLTGAASLVAMDLVAPGKGEPGTRGNGVAESKASWQAQQAQAKADGGVEAEGKEWEEAEAEVGDAVRASVCLWGVVCVGWGEDGAVGRWGE
jgi:hypothetical protein